MQNKTRKILCIVLLILFFAGLAVFLYPYFFRVYSETVSNHEIQDYTQNITYVQKDTTDPLDELYKDVYNYNKTIDENNQSDLKDQYSYQNPIINLEKYGIENNIFGYIDIPKLNVKLPVFLGASKENMLNGAVHLTYTSLPINQDNTNVVIAAHRGYHGAIYFRHIEQLQINDTISIINPWGKLTYTVIDKKIVPKDDVSLLHICKGEKLLTLSSCHPYPIDTYRYIIISSLSSYEPNM